MKPIKYWVSIMVVNGVFEKPLKIIVWEYNVKLTPTLYVGVNLGNFR